MFKYVTLIQNILNNFQKSLLKLLVKNMIISHSREMFSYVEF